MKILIILTSSFLLSLNTIFPQWIIQDFETINYAISFVDLNTGFVAHLEGIKKTTNSGENWSNITNGLTGLQRDIQFLNPSTGFAVSFGSPGNIGWISKTTNGGVNWITIQDSRMFSIFFINSNSGFAGGRGGRILKTTNSGLNWIGLNVNSIQDIMSVYFLNNNTGFAVYRDSNYNGNGGILKTTDGCNTWSDFNTTNRFNYIYSIDQNTLYATGYFTLNDTIRGKVYKSTNQGNNWSLIFNLPGYGFNCVTFTNTNTGYLGGAFNNVGAVIYKTTNQGQSWIEQWFDPTVSAINDIAFLNENTGWSAGYYGIRKTTNGGGILSIGNTSENNPPSFVLLQNYPNPFNPETKIAFSLKISQSVKLSVYNLSGKLIKILVNKYLLIGSHEYSFKGSEYPSGIYFYKLEAEGIKDVKKMVLIK